MGQKIHPGGLRVGVIHDWKSNWYTGAKEFPSYIIEDVKIRDHIYGKLGHAGLSDILIRKDKQRITIDIYTARPGIVIGKSGAEVDALREEVHGMTHKNVQININEIKRPELDAKLVAQSIAEQLQNRVSFRRAMKRSLASAIRSGAKGVKITCGGRLGGAEMSRSETYSRAASRCTPCAPTSTTASPRRRRPSAASASRSGSTRARSCPRASTPARAEPPDGWASRTRRAAAAAAATVSAPSARAAGAAAATARASARRPAAARPAPPPEGARQSVTSRPLPSRRRSSSRNRRQRPLPPSRLPRRRPRRPRPRDARGRGRGGES